MDRFDIKFDEKPWKLYMDENEPFRLGIGGYSDVYKQKRDITDIWLNEDDCEEQRANACLIIKSPDMFELLVESLDEFEKQKNTKLIFKIKKLLNQICNEDMEVEIFENDKEKI